MSDDISKVVTLLPCPFCASRNLYPAVFGRVWCRACDASASSIEAWNCRAGTAPEVSEPVCKDSLRTGAEPTREELIEALERMLRDDSPYAEHCAELVLSRARSA